MDDHIHLLHWDRAQEHPVAHDRSSSYAVAPLHLDLHRPRIPDHLPTSVRQVKLTRLQVSELKLDRDVFRHDEVYGTGIHNGIGRDLFQIRLGHVAQPKIGIGDFHRYSTLIPILFASSRFFETSATMSLLNASGAFATTLIERSESALRTSGEFSTATDSL